MRIAALMLMIALVAAPEPVGLAKDRIYEADISNGNCAVCRNQIESALKKMKDKKVKWIEFHPSTYKCKITMDGDIELATADVEKALKGTKYVLRSLIEVKP